MMKCSDVVEVRPGIRRAATLTVLALAAASSAWASQSDLSALQAAYVKATGHEYEFTPSSSEASLKELQASYRAATGRDYVAPPATTTNEAQAAYDKWKERQAARNSALEGLKTEELSARTNAGENVAVSVDASAGMTALQAAYAKANQGRLYEFPKVDKEAEQAAFAEQLRKMGLKTPEAEAARVFNPKPQVNEARAAYEKYLKTVKH